MMPRSLADQVSSEHPTHRAFLLDFHFRLLFCHEVLKITQANTSVSGATLYGF